MDTVHECDRRTDRQTELRSQRPCNAERRTVKTANVSPAYCWLIYLRGGGIQKYQGGADCVRVLDWRPLVRLVTVPGYWLPCGRHPGSVNLIASCVATRKIERSVATVTQTGIAFERETMWRLGLRYVFVDLFINNVKYLVTALAVAALFGRPFHLLPTYY